MIAGFEIPVDFSNRASVLQRSVEFLRSVEVHANTVDVLPTSRVRLRPADCRRGGLVERVVSRAVRAALSFL